MRGADGQDKEFEVIDYPAVKITGALSFAKVRAIWHGGLLRLFDSFGLVVEVETEQPQSSFGWLSRKWTAQTPKGKILMSSVCRCGFHAVAKIPAEELWNGG